MSKIIMVKFDSKIERDYYANRMFKGEMARYNMIAFCEHFIMNKSMTEKQFFDIQKTVLAKYRKDAEDMK